MKQKRLATGIQEAAFQALLKFPKKTSTIRDLCENLGRQDSLLNQVQLEVIDYFEWLRGHGFIKTEVVGPIGPATVIQHQSQLWM